MTTGSRVNDWATWFVRLMIPAILLGGWQAYQKLDDLTTKVAVIATKIDDHSKALAAIWKRLDETYEPAFSPGDPVKPQP